MNQIMITKEDLLKLLDKCFEEGYGGYLELKEDCVNSMLEGYLSSKNNLSNYSYNPTIYQPYLPGIDNISAQYDVRGAMPRAISTETISTETISTHSTHQQNSGQITLSFNY